MHRFQRSMSVTARKDNAFSSPNPKKILNFGLLEASLPSLVVHSTGLHLAHLWLEGTYSEGHLPKKKQCPPLPPSLTILG
jgi:hypothetical protein